MIPLKAIRQSNQILLYSFGKGGGCESFPPRRKKQEFSPLKREREMINQNSRKIKPHRRLFMRRHSFRIWKMNLIMSKYSFR